MRLMTIALAFLALFAVSLPAQTGEPGSKDKKRRAEILKKFDKNGDGKLDKEERKAMREAGIARKKKRLEEKKGKGTDGDQEKKKGKGRRRGDRGNREERLKKMMERFDKNGDGKLDESEREAMKKARAERRAKRGEKGGKGKPGKGGKKGEGSTKKEGTPIK